MPFVLSAIYRPGSSRVTKTVFTKLLTLLKSLLTFKCGIVLARDLNIHLENEADADSSKFVQLINCFNMHQFVANLTHALGGILNVVVASTELAPQDIIVTK